MSLPNEGRRGRSGGWLRLVNILIAVAVLGFIVVTSDPRQIWSVLRDVRLSTLSLAVLLNLPIVLLFSARSNLIVHSMGYRVPFAILVPISVLGNVAGSMTPAASGEVLRAVALQRVAGMKLEDALSLVLYERVISLYLLLLSASACLALISLPARPAIAACAGAAVLGILPWLTAKLLLPLLPARTATMRPGRVAKVVDYALGVAQDVRRLLLDLRLLASWSALTLLTIGLTAFQVRLLATSVSADLSLAEAWVVLAGFGVSTIASLLPFGLGVGDGSLVGILHALGLSLEQSTGVAVLLRAASTIPLVALASLCYLYLERRRGVFDQSP